MYRGKDGEGAGKWEWALDSKGCFTVKSLRYAIDDMRLKRCGPATSRNKIVLSKLRVFN